LVEYIVYLIYYSSLADEARGDNKNGLTPRRKISQLIQPWWGLAGRSKSHVFYFFKNRMHAFDNVFYGIKTSSKHSHKDQQQNTIIIPATTKTHRHTHTDTHTTVNLIAFPLQGTKSFI
jgi:hypothetical protein